MSPASIEAVRADIAAQRVDAIVNAANSRLARGAGVCGAIFAAAGPGLETACASAGGCAPGDAVLTPGFRLPASWIVHTVGPVWHGGDRGEPELLHSCYRRSIEVARLAGATSIAFPAISTGIYGYPAASAAEIAVDAVQQYGRDMLVRLVAFDAETRQLYASLL